ncbi:MAG: Lrp/AsnC family transcriptional regulator [Anaerolineales bacterium]|nr:Lrp/AsnC family transcriptional regulator [Anaerolineales bacterium]
MKRARPPQGMSDSVIPSFSKPDRFPRAAIHHASSKPITFQFVLDAVSPIGHNSANSSLFRKRKISAMYEFDKIDVKIVNLLLEDGRMSASELARRIGDISERAIRYRIERMIDDDVIRISAVIRPEAFGLTIKADVWLEVESDLILEVAKKMAEFENVTYVACAIGQNDISIQVVAKDTAEIYHFVTEVVRKVRGVRKTTTSIVPLVLKDVYQWRVPERISQELDEKQRV